ncbi:MAG: hypothetical protein ACR2QE_20575 [Acidimicrobiales bacterium]
MLPITPKGFRRYVKYNATRKGLFGGSKLWLGVYAAGRLRTFSGQLSKKGEAPLVFSGPVSEGHWAQVVHENPRPDRSAVKAGQRAATKADRLSRKAEARPTDRNIRRAVRAQVRSGRRNRSLGPERVAVATLSVDPSLLSRRQRRRLAKAQIAPLNKMEKLARKAIREYP